MKKIFICLFILILLVTGCTKKPDPVDPVPEDKGITVSELWTRLALEKEHVWNANDINIVFTKEGASYLLERFKDNEQSVKGEVSDFSYLGNNEYFFKIIDSTTGAVDDYKLDISSLPKSLVVYLDSGTYVMKDKHIEPVVDPEPEAEPKMTAEELLFILAGVESWSNSEEEFISVKKNGEAFYYMEGHWNSGHGTDYYEILSTEAKGEYSYALNMTWTVAKEDSEETEQVPVTVTVTYNPEKPDEVELVPYSVSAGTYRKDVNAAMSSDQLWQYLEGEWNSYTMPVPHRFYTENGSFYLEVLGDSVDFIYLLTDFHTSHYRYDVTFVFEGSEKYMTLKFNPAQPNVLTIDEDEFYKGE